MGFFSFGRKKKQDGVAAPSPPSAAAAAATTKTTTKTTSQQRPNKLVNNASASSTLSAATAASSSGSSSYHHNHNQATPIPTPIRPSTRANTLPSTTLKAIATADEGGRLLPPKPIRAATGTTAAAARGGIGLGNDSTNSSSSSLHAPIQPFAHPMHSDLSKKGSTNTLNSIASSTNGNGGNGTSSSRKRGAHEPPKCANLSSASKPRASSYHASSTSIRNIWTNNNNNISNGSRSELGHSSSMMFLNQTQNGSGYFGVSKYASTGTPGSGSGVGVGGFLMSMSRTNSYANLRGSSSGTPLNNQGAPLPGGGGGNAIAPDDEFKAYTRTYDATITRAHQLAREYHHLPPSKRDRQGYEKVGRAFAEAAKVSRVQWTLRCELEKERLETLLSPPPSSSKEEKKERKRQVEAEANGEYTSLHRIAGARAREGWEYASMLAEAWGVSEDVAVKEPLEEMAVLKPKWSQQQQYQQQQYQQEMSGGGGYGADEFGYGYGYGAGGLATEFIHPGYNQAAYAEYIAQQQRYQQQQQQGGGGGYTRQRNTSVRTRLDSGVSVVETTSTHSGGHYQPPVPRQRKPSKANASATNTTNANANGTAAPTSYHHVRTTSGDVYATQGQGQGQGAGVGAGRSRTTSGMSLNHSASLPALASTTRVERVHPNPNPTLNGYGGGGRSSNEGTPEASMTSSVSSASSIPYHTFPTGSTSSSSSFAAPAAVSPVAVTFPISTSTTTTTTTLLPSAAAAVAAAKPLPLAPTTPMAPVSNSMGSDEPVVKVIKLSKGRRYRGEGASAAAAA